MKQFSLLFLLHFTLYFFTFGQKGVIADGYIIKNNGDRVEGYIQVLGEVERMVKVRFSETKKAKKFPLYKTKDLLAYGFSEARKTNLNEEYIHVRHFMKYELDRPARILASNFSFIEQLNEGHFVAYTFLYETGSDVKNPIKTRYIVMQDEKEVCQIEEEGFKESAKQLFEGYDALVNSLGKLQFRFENFPRLIDDHNYWLENKHDPSQYKMNPKIFDQ